MWICGSNRGGKGEREGGEEGTRRGKRTKKEKEGERIMG